PGIITTVLILLVLGGVGAAIALNWDKVSDLISSFDQAADDEGPPLLAEPGAAEANAANPQPAAPAEDVRVVGAPQQPDVGLGQANPAAPANDALALAPAEEAGAPAAEAAAAAGAGAAAVADGNRAVLYEQIAETNDATRLEGRVSWRTSVVDGTTTLVANISVPERGLTIVLSFEPSGDTFVLNILFGLPEGFVGGGIDQVPRVVAKPEETVSGAELATAASPFPPDFFRLLFVEEAEASNLEALRTNEWFDLPVLYATGQRAIVSFQKGEEGREAVETALAAWTGQ
ncbi:MAG: hypothetical protein KIS96_11290, partial [Bauldia sp.]|nr:hypothetical protein [Bauldia sp.]